MMIRLLVPMLLLLLGAAQCPRAEPVQIDHQDLRLNANLVITGADWAQGPVVLMTHGTLAHAGMEIIGGLQGMLRDRGVSSLAINLSLGLNDRSAAMYDCPTPHTHRHADAVEEIGAWLAWLKAQGAARIALLGHSRGGNQTAWFAAERPDPAVSHVFLIAPGGWDIAHEADDYRKRYGQDLAPVLQRAREMVAAGKGGELMQPVDFIYCKQTAASAAAVLGYYDPAQLRDTAELLPKIPVPVVVFAGSADTAVPGVAARVEPLADGERLRLEILDGADHFFRDLFSEDIADKIAESLGS